MIDGINYRDHYKMKGINILFKVKGEGKRFSFANIVFHCCIFFILNNILKIIMD
jgi:hypothetical protein